MKNIKMANAVNPYGDGKAAEREVDVIINGFRLLMTNCEYGAEPLLKIRQGTVPVLWEGRIVSMKDIIRLRETA